jgi:hypothetical protein
MIFINYKNDIIINGFFIIARLAICVCFIGGVFNRGIVFNIAGLIIMKKFLRWLWIIGILVIFRGVNKRIVI